jgi:predicted DNA-binding ribbon-helix-helix protein
MLLAEIYNKFDEAARIAKAAYARAATGAIAEGVLVSMDIEQLIYDSIEEVLVRRQMVTSKLLAFDAAKSPIRPALSASP